MASNEPVGAFLDAADCAAALLGDPAVAEAWGRPSALVGFTVGGLAGHIYGGVRRLEVGLDEALPDAPRTVGVVEFYGINRVHSPDDLDTGLHPLLRDDGERRAEWGPAVVHERLAEVVERLRDRLPDEPLDRPIPVIQVPDGVTPLSVYLATRIVELVVHTDDLAVSLDIPAPEIPATATEFAVATLLELVRARSGDLALIHAFARAERSDPEALRAL